MKFIISLLSLVVVSLFSIHTTPITPQNASQIEIIHSMRTIGGHVRMLAFNPVDSNRLYAAQVDGFISVWDMTEGRFVDGWRAANSEVSALAFTVDGQWLITAGEDGTLRAWDVATKDQIRDMDITDTIPVVLAIATDGTIVVGYVDGTVRLWDIETGEHFITLYGYNSIPVAVDISADGRYIAVAYRFGTVFLYEIMNTRPPTMYVRRIFEVNSPLEDTWDMALHPHPDFPVFVSGVGIATVSNFDSVRFWDTLIGPEVRSWGTASRIDYPYRLSFSSDGRLVAIAGQIGVAGGACSTNLCGIEIVETGQIAHPDEDPPIPTPVVYATLQGHTTIPNDVTFSADDRYLASAYSDGVILIWGLPDN